jgi:hypothetical protein
MRRPRRPAAALAIAALVLLAHWLLIGILQSQLRAVRRDAGTAAERPRLQVRFVRVLQPRAPAPVLARPRPPPPRGAWLPVPEVPVLQAAAQAAAASAPGPSDSLAAGPAPQPPASAPAAEADPLAEAAAAAGPPAPASSPAGAEPAPVFEWPASTRLRYTLTGRFRGPIDGTAQVEWLHEGDRYQVFLDVQIGAPFAPLITRQMRSEGQIAEDGLRPREYEERTRLLWHEPRVFRIDFEPDAVRLPGRRRAWRPAGVQDAVSQFVQLTWRFTLDPTLLTTGHVLALPLALPSHVGTWLYDVRQAQTLYTPVGPVEAVHVQPRRQPRAGGDLVAEMWFAPTLQYLPVRILIRQDERNYVDLLLDRLPEQADSIGAGPPEGDHRR